MAVRSSFSDVSGAVARAFSYSYFHWSFVVFGPSRAIAARARTAGSSDRAWAARSCFIDCHLSRVACGMSLLLDGTLFGGPSRLSPLPPGGGGPPPPGGGGGGGPSPFVSIFTLSGITVRTADLAALGKKWRDFGVLGSGV